MTPAQREAQELLDVIDEDGRGLDEEEIEFIANLIDRPPQPFSVGEIHRLRALHRSKVQQTEDDDDEL